MSNGNKVILSIVLLIAAEVENGLQVGKHVLCTDLVEGLGKIDVA